MKKLFINSLLLASISVNAQQLIVDPTKPSYINNNSSATTSPKSEKVQSNQMIWTLETTLADSKRIIAVINGQQVTVGDEVDGAYVMKISHQQVTLKHADKLFDIKLQQSFTEFMK